MNKAQQAIIKIDEVINAWQAGTETPAAAYSAIKLLLESIPSLTDELTAAKAEIELFSLSATVDEMFFSADGLDLLQGAATAHAEAEKLMHLLSDRRMAG